MSDKQNSIPDPKSSATEKDAPCQPEGSESKSYYYDDSTGYELYKEEDADQDGAEQD